MNEIEIKIEKSHFDYMHWCSGIQWVVKKKMNEMVFPYYLKIN
jgi:hypothetical protein